MKLLDRYVLRNFMQAYVYCIASFISIWLIFDLSDNVSRLMEQRLSPMRVAQYYLSQTPQILIILLPVSLLLALLFSLGRMSRANEIVSMLTAGVSVRRILFPLVIVGILTSGLAAALNYSLVPHAESSRKELLDAMTVRRAQVGFRAQVFRNRSDNRTWFLQHFRPGSNEFSSVQILQQDAQHNITRAYFATRAFYRPETKSWEFQHGKTVDYDAAGNILRDQAFPSLIISDWTETPFRLMSTNMRPDLLSVPELRDYLRYNADFPAPLLASFRTHLYHRFALPWSCLVVVFIAGPLAIGFFRRGALSSVSIAVVLVVAMNFMDHLFLALGEGGRIQPWLAAWSPNIIFGTIGLYLLYLRSTHRQAPRFNLAGTRVMLAS